MLIYESEQKFELWDYMDGHRVLVLRGESDIPDTFKYIEIEFLDVFYLNIPTSLAGISVSKMSDIEIQKLRIGFHKKSVYNNFFIIQSGEKQFVVGAMSVSAYYTKAEGALSSIRQNINMSDLKIIASSVDIR